MKWIWLDTPQDHYRWGVEVKPSLFLNQKELGLFTIKNFNKNEKIAPYLGEELSLEQRKQRYGKKWGPYIYFKPWGHPSIDAIFFRGAAAFANDGTWIPNLDNSYTKRTNNLSNVYLERGWLKANQNIPSNTELLLDYGESYWKNRFTNNNNIIEYENPILITAKDLEMKKTKKLKKIGGNMTENMLCLTENIMKLTPVENYDKYWIKRDDLFSVCGVNGGKARACLDFICSKLNNNIIGVISGGSRSSPQVQIVGHIAKCLKLKARLHIPQGPIPNYIRKSTTDMGHEIFQWFPGFNHVISARVKEDIKNHTGWLEIPFGMEFQEAINCNSNQVKNLPFTDKKFLRIVVPVGSGMTLISIITGLNKLNINIPILGVIVGKDPVKTLDKWLKIDWRKTVTLVKSSQNYHKSAPNTTFNNIQLDPIYEAKILPFIKPGDLLWIIGHREN